jgi:hypothetical protein
MPIGGQLPPKCVKSNQPTEQFLKRNLTWYPPWIALTIFLAWPIFLILVLIMQKKATVFIGLTPQWRTRRIKRILIAWGLALAGVALFIAGISLVDPPSAYSTLGGTLLALSPISLLSGILFGLIGCRLVYPKKIDDRFIWLKGVCPEYLADLPNWPGPRA